MLDRQWYQLHPLTCIVICAALAVISYFNFKCRIFFGPGSTSVLRFSHGWPFPFREAPVPGPGQRDPNPNGVLPNFIWGHPEFNDDPKIMESVEARIHDFPRRPWQLHHIGKFSKLLAIIDILFGVALLSTVGCFSEIAVRNNGRQIESSIPLVFMVALIVISCVPLLLTPDAPIYAVAVLTVALLGLVAIARVLSVGYRNA